MMFSTTQEVSASEEAATDYGYNRKVLKRVADLTVIVIGVWVMHKKGKKY